MLPELQRSITWIQGTALTIGAVLGCGILILPSVTADTVKLRLLYLSGYSCLFYLFFLSARWPACENSAQRGRNHCLCAAGFSKKAERFWAGSC